LASEAKVPSDSFRVVKSGRPNGCSSVASVVEVAIVTAIYLNSAIRLTRLKELAPVT
jgi:hypothetical protein